MSDELLVLSADDVAMCLPMNQCIDAMRLALIAVSQGDVHNPLRMTVMPPFDRAPGLLGLMPAIRGGEQWLYGLKEVCVFPGNHHIGIDSHQGSVLLHDGETGRLMAIMNGSAITAIRTAAATAAASEVLARKDSKVLALVGAGIQARWHLEALTLVHELDEIRVCSARTASAARFVDTWSSNYPVSLAESVEVALAGADIVTTVTNSSEPVLHREWLSPGTHINAVGSSFAAKRELDTTTIAASRLFVDRRESTINESGDYLLALADGAIKPDHIVAEVGEVLMSSTQGRHDNDDLTVFKSLGLAIEDVMAAEVAFANAQASDRGTTVPF